MTKPQTLFLTVGLLSFIVYICTLAPTITWRNDGVDSGDLATAVAVGGVPHPPGYPTYLILGEVFKLLPFGDVAYRLNLLSATCAALTVAVLGLVIYQTLSTMTEHDETHQAQSLIWLCAASASLTLAFSGAFWSQSVIAEVYTLNALFGAGLLYVAWQVGPSNQNWLVPVLFGLLGLSLGNHFSILLLVPLLFWILQAQWRWPMVLTAFFTFWLGLSIYLIIPIRAAAVPPVNWGLATNWPNFWWLVSAKAYRPLLFALPWEFVPARLAAAARLLAEVFMGWGLPVSLLGLQYLIGFKSSPGQNPADFSGINADRFRKAGKVNSLGYSSLLTFLLVVSYAIGYDTTDSYIYLLLALLMTTLWLGWGLYGLGHVFRSYLDFRPYSETVSGGVLICLPLLSLWLNFSEQNISQDREAFAYAQHSLQSVAADAVIITDDDRRTFALWYGRYGLAQRPDVAVVNINLLPYTWYQQTLHQTHANLLFPNKAGPPSAILPAFIQLNLAHSPIYLATLQPLPLEEYRLESTQPLPRVVKPD